jgi:hypothetical protein
MSRTWIYHETEEPKIVDMSEAQSFYDDGWKDSPRYFVKTTDFNIDANDAIKVQQLGESIEGVKDALNGALNLSEMTAKGLLEYAEVNYGKKLKGKTKALRVAEIEKLINSGSVH